MATKQQSLATDLTVGSVPRQLIAFAAPLMVSGLLQTVYNVVDAAVVGKVVGSSALAGVSIGGDLTNALMIVANGFAGAGQVLISQYTGAGKADKVKKTIGTLFTVMFIMAMVGTVGCLLLQDQLMGWMNTPAEAWEQTRNYLVPCLAGTVFIFGYNLVSAILRGMGDSRRPFIFIAIATVVNIVLDLLFVAVFSWGTFGAAIATVIGQGASFVLSIIFLYRNRERFGFDFKLKSFAVSKEVFVPLIKLGVPMMLQSAAIHISRLFVGARINAYGVLATAVTGIGNKLDTAVNMLTHSMSTASGSMVGQNIGAEKYDRVPKVILWALVCTGVIAAVMSLVMVLFPAAVFGLFTDEADTLEMAMTYIPVVLVNFGSSMLRAPLFGLINGSGNAGLNLLNGIMDGVVVRIGLALLLGEVLSMGIYGYWYGAAFAGYVPFFIGGIFLLSGKWKTRKHVVKD